MSVYYHLYERVAVIADNYSVGSLICGYTCDLINILLRNHIDKIRAASDYTAMLAMIEDGLSAHIGTRLQVSTFITKEDDRRVLFSLLQEKRSALLAESMETITI